MSLLSSWQQKARRAHCAGGQDSPQDLWSQA
jgi:hypothetical protein